MRRSWSPTPRRSTSCSWRLGRARTVRDVITAALATIREAFGWSYGSFWEVQPEEQALRYSTTRARSARTSAGSRPRLGSARVKGSTARPGRRGTWSSCPTWAR